MIPVLNYEVAPEIPERATFWMPTEDDIPDDEGLGYFRDVWMILNEPLEYTRRVIESERGFITLVDRLAESVQDYETLASLIENGETERVITEPLLGRLKAEAREILEWTEDDELPLRSLELGVAGLSYALSTIGSVPVASCRGHMDGWSDQPVVYAAIDEQRAHWLQPLVQEAGCGFHIGMNREEFLAIDGPSIHHTNNLAQAVVSKFGGHTEMFDRWLDLDAIYTRYE
ncbi:hypothetical protein [Streptomyces sp. TRM68416]|uniref:hypothetical protein n=1 Tax=Streptomyces sp. TRM68416 TaxID=2758412 RepID=UPI0016618E29|nr:hypothetical protein [Streptomyces sp. TRM68416]MBD0843276.1 hypothetical protein [Streptomyces sp. TRM68416]